MGRWRWDEAVRVERRGEADCHKFKQQLTFRVGGFPHNVSVSRYKAGGLGV